MEKLYHLGSLTEHITIQNVLGLVCTLAIFMYRDNLLWAVNSWRSPLRHLAGPKNDNLALGNQVYLMKKQNSTVWEEWVEKYGKTLRIRGFFGGPAFGQPQIQALVPVFCENANRLRDLWLEFMGNNPEGATIDVLQGLSRATLDSIGMTGFGYEFNSLQDGDEYELAKGFAGVFNSDKDTTTLTVIKAMVCQGLGIPTEETRHLKANMATTRRIGMKIVKDKKAMLLQGEKNGAASKERDLLSLLIKSNMTQETNGDQAMSDEEVLGHISTFLSGGQETTSTSTTWALYALALYPTVQNKLRKELLSAGLSEAPSMGELDKLPYLDNFVREVLRVYAVAPMVSRQAVQDAVIPVAESYKDRYGVVQTEIRVQKWDTVMIPILAMNRAKDVWGEDALEFKYVPYFLIKIQPIYDLKQT
ncbi:hypothetical protein FRC10_003851 [Ceratobasidium sp. 414]|nr:hypothetical protein FRC10_003851 [Ceratobasidium sp. 414]